MLGEFRAGLEFFEALTSKPQDDLPHGNGKAVLLIPGLWGGDNSLFVLRRNLAHLGYDARTWGLGTNNRCGEATVEHLLGRVGALAAKRPGRVALIGHSRGGFMAREAARRAPNLIQIVITLGTPIGGRSLNETAPAVRALLAVSRRLFAEREGCMTERCDCDYVRGYDKRLPEGVTAYSLWSKEDGVVPPERCVVKDEPNIEVGGTHVGMVVNGKTFAVIARLLAGDQP